MSLYDMKPLEELIRDGFYPASLLRKKSYIENIINELATGIYVIGGDRGSGKTTLMNSVKKGSAESSSIFTKKSQKEKFFLHINVADEETDLLRELILYLEEIYSNNEGLFKNTNCDEEIEKLKVKILFDICFEEIEENFNRSSKTINSKTELKGKFAFQKLISMGGNLATSKIKLTQSEIKNRTIKSPRQRKEDLIKEVINLFETFSEKISIIIILDELDKLEDSHLETFIESNKIHLTESSAIFFLIVNSIKYVNLKYSNNYSALNNLVREYIFLPRMNWQEFILIVPKFLKMDNLEALQKIYYKSIGNFREIVKLKKNYNDYYSLRAKRNSSEFEKETKELFNLLMGIMDNDYIKELPDGINEIAVDLIRDVLNVVSINKHITEHELLETKKGYLSSNIILNSVINKVEIIIRSYVTQSEAENSKSLKEELAKYYKPKMFFGLAENYQCVILNTSEVGTLYRLLDIFFESIDGVIICKEEQKNRGFNISYTATILISNDYMQPIKFINKKGFAWNFEYSARYEEMLKYLEETNIKYIDIELPLSETMLEKEDLTVFDEAFKKKYDFY